MEAVVGLLGVVVGIGAKWAIDITSERSRRGREDALRFIGDKRSAYTAFLAACEEIADARQDLRLLDAYKLKLDSGTSVVYDEDLAEIKERRDRYARHYEAAHRDVNAALAVVDMVAPTEVCALADAFAVTAHRPHLHPRRTTALQAFARAARSDLGVGGDWTISGVEYEPWDDDEADSRARQVPKTH